VSVLVAFDGFFARLPSGDAGRNPFLLHRIAEPVGIIAPVAQQPLGFGQAIKRACCAGLIADPRCRHEDADWTTIGIRRTMKRRLHAAFGALDQPTRTPYRAIASSGRTVSLSGHTPWAHPAKSVPKLAGLLSQACVATKVRTMRDGLTRGGIAFSHNCITASSRPGVYCDETVHKNKVYPSDHQTIVDENLFDGVQRILAHHTATYLAPDIVGAIIDGEQPLRPRLRPTPTTRKLRP
jgi:hypothetical protein